MGNSHSSPAQTCLLSAMGNDPSLVAFAGQPFYQAVAVQPYNLNIPVSPMAVTFPETSQQIADIVKCAADYGYKVQARSGGHSYGNYGLGGNEDTVTVDLKNFQQFSMDNSTYEATIGSGMLLGDVSPRLYDAGKRAMAHGVCPQVGSGGHFTIGGLGPLSRQWGTALDHVQEVEVVLANSSIVRASDEQYQDVFFAVKGAGASFGIVTEFKVRTQRAPEQAVRYMYRFNMGSTAERAQMFKDWQSFVSKPELSRKFSTLLTIMEGTVILSGQFYGSKEEFDQLGFEQHFSLDQPGQVTVINDWLAMAGPSIESLALQIGGGIPTHFYAKSLAFAPETLMPTRTVDDLIHYLDKAEKGSLLWFINFDLEAGAINDVPANATAYPHRDVLYWAQTYIVNLFGAVPQTSLDFLDGINELVAKSVPGACDKAYPGYVDPFMTNAQEAYWRSNLPKLQEVKAAVDPDDVFHYPQSVSGAKT
ncbi:glucooligosaccharide oxidase [Aspergillus sp. HF37]|nr:glucooligosaccharide oxidase [Aspergillus sp. HF37]